MVTPNLPSRFKSAVRDFFRSLLIFALVLLVVLPVLWIEFRFVDPLIRSAFPWLVRFSVIEGFIFFAATLVTMAAVLLVLSGLVWLLFAPIRAVVWIVDALRGSGMEPLSPFEKALTRWGEAAITLLGLLGFPLGWMAFWVWLRAFSLWLDLPQHDLLSAVEFGVGFVFCLAAWLVNGFLLFMTYRLLLAPADAIRWALGKPPLETAMREAQEKEAHDQEARECRDRDALRRQFEFLHSEQERYIALRLALRRQEEEHKKLRDKLQSFRFWARVAFWGVVVGVILLAGWLSNSP